MCSCAEPDIVHDGESEEREGCIAADAADSLSRFRERFILPEGVIYLDGNSLGPRAVGALERVQDVVTTEWGEGLIHSWNTAGWFELPGRLGDKLAQLIGGSRGETVVTDTTSLNQFKALGSAIRIQQIDHPEKRVIVTERDNFPSDIYIAEGIADFLNSVAPPTTSSGKPDHGGLGFMTAPARSHETQVDLGS